MSQRKRGRERKAERWKKIKREGARVHNGSSQIIDSIAITHRMGTERLIRCSGREY